MNSQSRHVSVHPADGQTLRCVHAPVFGRERLRVRKAGVGAIPRHALRIYRSCHLTLTAHWPPAAVTGGQVGTVCDACDDDLRVRQRLVPQPTVDGNAIVSLNLKGAWPAVLLLVALHHHAREGLLDCIRERYERIHIRRVVLHANNLRGSTAQAGVSGISAQVSSAEAELRGLEAAL